MSKTIYLAIKKCSNPQSKLETQNDDDDVTDVDFTRVILIAYTLLFCDLYTNINITTVYNKSIKSIKLVK